MCLVWIGRLWATRGGSGGSGPDADPDQSRSPDMIGDGDSASHPYL